ncbi:MAG: hypothetical protein LC623_05190 [Halobacteriales archaeon]|nr:hypothetical protein [Halobacteriales archaeon]
MSNRLPILKLALPLLLLSALVAGCVQPQATTTGPKGSALHGWPAVSAAAEKWQKNATLILIGGVETEHPLELLRGGPDWAIDLFHQPDANLGDGLAPAWLYTFKGHNATLYVVVDDGGNVTSSELPASARLNPEWWPFAATGDRPLRQPLVDSDQVAGILAAHDSTWKKAQGKTGTQVFFTLAASPQPYWMVGLVNKSLRLRSVNALDAVTGQILDPSRFPQLQGGP